MEFCGRQLGMFSSEHLWKYMWQAFVDFGRLPLKRTERLKGCEQNSVTYLFADVCPHLLWLLLAYVGIHWQNRRWTVKLAKLQVQHSTVKHVPPHFFLEVGQIVGTEKCHADVCCAILLLIATQNSTFKFQEKTIWVCVVQGVLVAGPGAYNYILHSLLAETFGWGQPKLGCVAAHAWPKRRRAASQGPFGG